MIRKLLRSYKTKRQLPAYLDSLTSASNENSADEKVLKRLDKKFLKTRLGRQIFKTEPYPSELKPIYIIIITLGLILISFNFSKIFKINLSLLLLIIFLLEGGILFNLFRKRKKVKDLVEENLPETLETMARVYRIYPDLETAIQEVNTYITQTQVKAKFADIIKLSRFGYTPEQAMEIVASDLSSPDFDFVITSIKLNTPLGGNLANLFEKTANVLRKRKETSYEIGNVMFQNKVSATISAALVPFITILAFTSSKNYQKVLLEDPTGRLVFMGSLLWWLIGVYLVVRASRVRI